MTIKEYIINKQMTLSSVAKELGYSRVHITNVANGAVAGPSLARKLVIWSNGALKIDDLLFPKKPSY